MVTDRQPLLTLEILAFKVDRVQRWYDILSAYSYTLKYRPRKKNSSTNMMSRLPFPATTADSSEELRLTDPGDIDADVIGVSGVQPADVRATLVSSLGGLASLAPSGLASEEERVLPVGTPLTTYRKPELSWILLQADFFRRWKPRRTGEVMTVADKSSSEDSNSREVVSGQWESGRTLHVSISS